MKKLLVSLTTTVAMTVLVVGSTGAFFSSTATSTSNTISTGSLSILLSDDNQTNKVNISNSWEGANLAPGQKMDEAMITIKNAGTVDADHMDVTFSYNGSHAIAKKIIFDGPDGLRLGQTKSASANLLALLSGTHDTEYQVQKADGTTLGDIRGNDGDATSLSLFDVRQAGKIRIVKGTDSAGMDAGTDVKLWINSVLDSSVTAQGETIDATISFTLDQDVSQN